jgi:hypothetical protein
LLFGFRRLQFKNAVDQLLHVLNLPQLLSKSKMSMAALQYRRLRSGYFRRQLSPTRPTLRFVEIKTCEQQGTLVLYRVRLMLIASAIECDPRPYGGVRPGGSGGPQWPSAIDRHPGDPGR